MSVAVSTPQPIMIPEKHVSFIPVQVGSSSPTCVSTMMPQSNVSNNAARVSLVKSKGKAKSVMRGFRPGQYDVLCNRSRNAYNHIGNRRFRILVECHGAAYKKMTTKAEKSATVLAIVKTIEAAGGRFVSRSKGGEWEVLPLIKKKEKVGHQLRAVISAMKSGQSRTIYDVIGAEDSESFGKLPSAHDNLSLALSDALVSNLREKTRKRQKVCFGDVTMAQCKTNSSFEEVKDEREDVKPTEASMPDLCPPLRNHPSAHITTEKCSLTGSAQLCVGDDGVEEVDALFEMFKPEEEDTESAIFLVENQLKDTLDALDEIADKDALFGNY